MSEKRIEKADLSDLEIAFFNDGYRLATEWVKEDKSSSSLKLAMLNLYDILDSFIDLFLKNAKEENSPADCKKGCAFCCHQAVFAQYYEFKYLKDWMFDHLTADELDSIRISAKQKKNNTKSLTKEIRLLHKEACPLLLENVCIAYEARPVACRIYLSMNVESCRYEYKNPSDASRFPQLFDLTLRAGRKLNEGFASRLQELGYDVTEYPIEEGLLL